MDYEKAYKEALERAKKEWSNNLDNAYKNYRERLEIIFPELKESEDERIRRNIIAALKGEGYYDCDLTKECIAWVKKQGEQKSVDKVEPKFQNGQWVVWQNKCYKVNYNGCGYELIDQNGLTTSCEYGTIDENAHLWTIEDAKDGDVLVDVYGNIGIYEKRDNFDWTSYCSLGFHGGFQNFKVEHENDKTHPATEEQRDTFFAKMKEEGYEWDAENKILKKIES